VFLVTFYRMCDVYQFDHWALALNASFSAVNSFILFSNELTNAFNSEFSFFTTSIGFGPATEIDFGFIGLSLPGLNDFLFGLEVYPANH